MDSRTCPQCRYPITIRNDGATVVQTCPRCQAELVRPVSFELNQDPSQQESLAESSATVTSASRSDGAPKISGKIGRFEVRGLLGQGGFGYVLRGFDPVLDREVAIKVPKATNLSQERADKIVEEARAAARLRHPNIVAVHEVGREDGLIYIVTDFINGQTLSQLLKSKRPSPQQAAQWCAALARGLHQAHLAGIVHRDFKPGNVIIDEHNQPLIADFGLALRNLDNKPNDDSDVPSDQSLGGIVGTPAYMSPEQAAGLGNDAKAQSDIYSLGVVLYELLAGRRPFSGTLREIIQQAIFADPPSLKSLQADVPPELAAICQRAMRKKPEERFATALELAEDLERYLAGKPTRSLPVSSLKLARSHVARQKWSIVLGCVLTVGLIVGGWTWWQVQSWFGNRCRVLLVTEPVNCQVALVPIDPSTGQLRRDAIIRPPISEQYLLTLDPGWYLVEAYHPNVGVQEVYRFVSRQLTDYDGVLDRGVQSTLEVKARCVQRIESNGRIVWPSIRLSNQANAERDTPMTMVPGGPFRSGSDVFAQVFPMHDVQVPAYWLGNGEVTVQRFKSVMGRLPRAVMEQESPVDPLAAVGGVDYWDAIEFAERSYMRLPLLEEYLFAATNQGATKFPWGDDVERIAQWSFLTADNEFDRAKTWPTLQGLYSGVVEWTQSVPEMQGKVPPIPPRLREQTGVGDWPNARFMVGGGPSIRQGKPNQLDFAFGPRGFGQVWILEKSPIGMGLRVARSLMPRFVIPQTPPTYVK